MIKNNIDVAGSMDEVYNGKVPRRTIQTINEIRDQAAERWFHHCGRSQKCEKNA